MRRLLRLLIALGFLGAGWVLVRELLESAPPPVPGSAPGGAGAGAPASPAGAAGSPPSTGPAAKTGQGAGGPSKAELYERAKRLGIEGRSKMSKDELAAAIARVGESAT